MDTREVRELLPLHADGELDAGQAAAVEAAVATDPGLQAELERWRSLRRSAQRGMQAALPAGLQDRISGSIQRERNRSRIMKLIVPLSAAAAVVLLAIVLRGDLLSNLLRSPERVGGNGIAARLVADQFARVHEKCAVQMKHDPYETRNAEDVAAAIATSQCDNKGVAIEVPRLAGYAAQGCCQCLDRDKRVKALHVYYQSESQAVVSLFVTEGLIQVLAKKDDTSKPAAYQQMQVKQLGLIKWDEKQRSYAMVAKLNRNQLEQLVNQIRVAGWISSQPPIAMATSRR